MSRVEYSLVYKCRAVLIYSNVDYKDSRLLNGSFQKINMGEKGVKERVKTKSKQTIFRNTNMATKNQELISRYEWNLINLQVGYNIKA